MMKRDSDLLRRQSRPQSGKSDAEHGGADKARHKLGVRHPWGKNPSMTL
jgi:hypothetical protein